MFNPGLCCPWTRCSLPQGEMERMALAEKFDEFYFSFAVFTSLGVSMNMKVS